jgi:hypothetical protein
MDVEAGRQELLDWAKRWQVPNDTLVPLFRRLSDAATFAGMTQAPRIEVDANEVSPEAQEDLVSILRRYWG